MVTRKKTASKSRKKKVAAKRAATRKPAKKKAAKKKVTRKRTTARKAATKKAGTKRKATVRKKTVGSKKKATTKKKAVTKKKATTKKAAAKKKAVKKPAAKKKAPAKKKTTARKKPVAKKKTTRKAATRKTSRKKSPGRKTKRRVSAAAENLPAIGPVAGIAPYKLRAREKYMNKRQLKHFEFILKAWKGELMAEANRTVHHMKDEAANFPDPNDRATQESEFSLELRTRDRERKLIKKIDEAIATVESHDYGYCESCGVEIGVRRLEARPTATLCIDCKTLDEIREKQMRT